MPLDGRLAAFFVKGFAYCVIVLGGLIKLVDDIHVVIGVASFVKLIVGRCIQFGIEEPAGFDGEG